MKFVGKSRVGAVAVGAAILALLAGTGGAVAHGMIDSNDIRKNAIKPKHLNKNSVRSVHIKRNQVTAVEIKGGSVKPRNLAPGLRERVTNPAVGAQFAQLAEPTTIDIGGPINDRNTDLSMNVTLEPGTYLVTLGGAFRYADGATIPDADVYPQLSLWLDHDGDGKFDWTKDEGSISPNAQLPALPNRHIQVGDTTVITLEKETKVGVVAHGYDEEEQDAGSGAIEVFDATLTATPVR